MTTATYDIRAQLMLQSRGAYGEVRKVAAEVRQLGEDIKTSRSAFRDMVGQALAFGGAYLGVRAVGNAFVGLTKSAVAFTSEMEASKIGLQSVLAAVENSDWETAGKRASAAFEQIRMMAVQSPATAAEMFDIFNGIVGPVEAAGFSMQKVLDLTKDTTLAAAALNEDFPQASRDINMMARGMAGAHVKLFSMLKATGAIKEDAEDFNKLAPEKRIELIAAGLGKFAKGGAAFGSSWKGVTSTLQDIFDNLKASAFSPILKVMGHNLERFNNLILAHRQEIEAFLTNVGRSVANRVETVFVKAELGFRYIMDHWDTIVARFHTVVGKVKEIAPIIARAALAWEVANIGRNVVGTAVSAAGGAMNAIGTVGQFLGGGGKAVGAAIGAGGNAAQLGGLFGQMGAGAGAAGGAGQLAGLFGQMGGATGAAGGAAAAGGEGMAAFSTSLAALAPVLGVIAAVLAVLLAVGMAFADQWKNMSTIFVATGGQTLDLLLKFGETLWNFLAPILKGIGSVLLIPLTVLWTAFTVVARTLLIALTWLFDIFGAITNGIWNLLKPAFDFLFDQFRWLADAFNGLFGDWIARLKAMEDQAKGPRLGKTDELSTEPTMDYAMWQGNQNAIDLSKAAKGAVNITQDFRGSRISIKQEFKGDADPDRIVMAQMDALTRQAENRISSGYAGALTR